MKGSLTPDCRNEGRSTALDRAEFGNLEAWNKENDEVLASSGNATLLIRAYQVWAAAHGVERGCEYWCGKVAELLAQ